MNRGEQEWKRRRAERRTALVGAVGIFAGLVALYALLTDATGTLDPVLFPGWGVILPQMAESSGELLRGLYFSLRLLIPALG